MREAGLNSFATSRLTSKPDPVAIFAALGNQTRLDLLSRLSDGETRSIVNLSVESGMTRQAVAKHLGILEEAGLVSSAREGRESRFGYRPDALAVARSYLDEVSRQWDDAITRLRTFVEAPEDGGRR